MKNITLFLVISILLYSCRSDKVSINDLHIVGMTNNEVVNMNLKSGSNSSFNVGCHVFTSGLYDHNSGGYGYVGCESVFHLINPDDGTELINFALPALVSGITVDSVQNNIIGVYWLDTINYIIKVNLTSGNIISDNPVSLGGYIDLGTYFFNQNTNNYTLLRSDNALVSINPSNGSIVSEIQLDAPLVISTYDQKSNKLYGVSYVNNMNYVSIIDVSTGSLEGQVAIQEQFSFLGNVISFDSETNNLILVSALQEVKFIDINTGQITDTYSIGYDLKEFQFWRD